MAETAVLRAAGIACSCSSRTLENAEKRAGPRGVLAYCVGGRTGQCELMRTCLPGPCNAAADAVYQRPSSSNTNSSRHLDTWNVTLQSYCSGHSATLPDTPSIDGCKASCAMRNNCSFVSWNEGEGCRLLSSCNITNAVYAVHEKVNVTNPCLLCAVSSNTVTEYLLRRGCGNGERLALSAPLIRLQPLRFRAPQSNELRDLANVDEERVTQETRAMGATSLSHFREPV